MGHEPMQVFVWNADQLRRDDKPVPFDIGSKRAAFVDPAYNVERERKSGTNGNRQQ